MKTEEKPRRTRFYPRYFNKILEVRWDGFMTKIGMLLLHISFIFTYSPQNFHMSVTDLIYHFYFLSFYPNIVMYQRITYLPFEYTHTHKNPLVCITKSYHILCEELFTEPRR